MGNHNFMIKVFNDIATAQYELFEINEGENEEIDHEWNLNDYERLITETLETLSNYGEINQHNNSFTLRIATEFTTSGGAFYTNLNDLEDELLENLKWIFMG